MLFDHEFLLMKVDDGSLGKLANMADFKKEMNQLANIQDDTIP